MFLVSRGRWLTGWALLSIVASCGGGEAAAPAWFTERDSAGITIVENAADTAALGAGWSLEPEPLLTIGGLDADESQQVFQVAGGLRLPDGRIAIANGGTSDIRIFAPAGTLAATHGRKGEGPGEFSSVQLAGSTGEDSLIVFDPDLRRVSIIDADTGYVRSYLIGSGGGGFPLSRGALAGGSLLLGGGMRFSSDEGFPSGLVRPPSRYMVVGPDGETVGDLGELPAAEMFARVTATSFTASGVPFGKVTAVAAASGHVWVGTGETWELRAHAPDAHLERIVRFDRTLRPVTPALMEAFIEERAEEADDENLARSVRASLAEMPAPADVPPYQLFETDALDCLWIGEYLLPGEDTRAWTILDPDGRVTGRLFLPPRTRPLDIGPDWLLGVTTDELDVERLTLWRLRRPAR